MSKHFYLLAALLAGILLSACNPFLLERWYFPGVEPGEVYDNSFEVKTVYASDIYQYKNGTFEQAGRIPAKTNLRVLAALGANPADGNDFTVISMKAVAWYVVEQADGTRVLAEVPEAMLALKTTLASTGDTVKLSKVEAVIAKDKKKSYKLYIEGSETAYTPADFKFDRGNLAVYYPESRPALIAAGEVEQKVLGKTLEEAEVALLLADRIVVDKGVKTAYFNSFVAEKDSLVLRPLALTLVGDTVRAIDWSGAQLAGNMLWPWQFWMAMVGMHDDPEVKPAYQPDSKFKRFLAGNNFILDALPDPWVRPGWLAGVFMPGFTARAVISVILSIVLFLFFYLFLLRWLVEKAIFYIRPLTNRFVINISFGLYMLLMGFTILIFGIGLNFFLVLFMLVVFTWYVRMSIVVDVEYHRCPYCHKVGEVHYVGVSDKKVSHSEETVKDREFVVDKIVETYRGSERVGSRKEGHHEDVSRRIRYTTKRWKDNLHCSACGKDIVYSRLESESKEVGRTRVRV